jgi:hypothetical protein
MVLYSGGAKIIILLEFAVSNLELGPNPEP